MTRGRDRRFTQARSRTCWPDINVPTEILETHLLYLCVYGFVREEAEDRDTCRAPDRHPEEQLGCQCRKAHEYGHIRPPQACHWTETAETRAQALHTREARQLLKTHPVRLGTAMYKSY